MAENREIHVLTLLKEVNMGEDRLFKVITIFGGNYEVEVTNWVIAEDAKEIHDHPNFRGRIKRIELIADVTIV